METSMQNAKFPFDEKNEVENASRILTTKVEKRIVQKMSTIKVADVQDKLKLKAKNRKLPMLRKQNVRRNCNTRKLQNVENLKDFRN